MDTAFAFKVDELLATMMLNVAGPGHLAEVLLPLLEKGRQRVIMNMSTGLASIGLNYGAKCATYSISKVALNMLVRGPFPTAPARTDARRRRISRARRSRILLSSAWTPAG